MATWRELPDHLSPQARRLVGALRGVKDRSGLSLAALAGRTGYSSSSWERYLNGKKLPPEQAVAEFAEAARGNRDQLLELHSLAAAGWSRDSAGEPDPEPEPGEGPQGLPESRTRPEPEPGTEPGTEAGSASIAGADAAAGAGEAPAGARRDRRALLAGVLAAVLVLAAAGGIWAWTGREDDTPADRGPFTYAPEVRYDCPVDRVSGALTAGYSQERQALVAQPQAGWDVVEVQCLLEYHGHSVDGVDGAYGPKTERAVRSFQESSGELVADGMVGPHTWEVLRR